MENFMQTVAEKTDYINEIKRFFNPLTEEQQAFFFNEIKKMYKQKIEQEILNESNLLKLKQDIEQDKNILKFNNNQDGFSYLENLMKCE